MTWYYALRGLSLLFLPIAFNFNFYGLRIYAIFYGLDWVATVPPTVRLAGNVFGEENAALMFGWIAASHQIGAASGGLAGWRLANADRRLLDRLLFVGPALSSGSLPGLLYWIVDRAMPES